ncbi:MAG: hypothetical protein C0401_04980 [Anaerolinea sp.]|nr:hypothetical protein [Anaerolinea sp.]
MKLKIGFPKRILWIIFLLLSIAVLTVFLQRVVTSRYAFGADFSIYWNAGKGLFVEHINPYSTEITERIQQGIYGRLALPTEDQVRYAYPPFSLLSILPSVWFTYDWAQAYWMAFNIILLFFSVAAALRKPKIWIIGLLIFFYPVVRGIILGQFAFLISSLLILSLGLIFYQKIKDTTSQLLCGVIFAFTTMKPQLVWPVLLFVALYAFRNRLWGIAKGYALGIVVFAGIGWALLPGWVAQWGALIKDYVGYVPIKPILGEWAVFFGLDWEAGWIKSISIGLCVIISLLSAIRWWRNKESGLTFLTWLILFGQLINVNPNSMLSDQLIFLVPLLFWLNQADFSLPSKLICWLLFIIVPWGIFLLNFSGKEPFEVASSLALLFLIWFVYLRVYPLFTKRLDFHTS